MAVDIEVGYVGWAVLGLIGYTFFTPLAEIATETVPSSVVALVTNSVLALTALGIGLYAHSDGFLGYVTGSAVPYMLGAGVFLTIGILAYYRALSIGPISVVIPIFGMFIVTSSILGVLFLGESASLRKVAGIVLAGVAVYLTVTG
jgi:transporter family protein